MHAPTHLTRQRQALGPAPPPGCHLIRPQSTVATWHGGPVRLFLVQGSLLPCPLPADAAEHHRLGVASHIARYRSLFSPSPLIWEERGHKDTLGHTASLSLPGRPLLPGYIAHRSIPASVLHHRFRFSKNSTTRSTGSVSLDTCPSVSASQAREAFAFLAFAFCAPLCRVPTAPLFTTGHGHLLLSSSYDSMAFS